MTKQRAKRAISLVVALVLVVTLLPVVPAMAAGTYSWQTVLAGKYEQGEDGVIKLTGNVEGFSYINFTDGEKATLDLNGHTLSGTLGCTIWVDRGATLTIKDSSDDKSGKITSSVAGTYSLITVQNSTLTIEGGTIEQPEDSKTPALFVGDESGHEDPSTVTMTGGTIKSHIGADQETSAISINNCTFTMNGGTFDVATSTDVNAVSIMGSTFNMESGTIQGTVKDNYALVDVGAGSVFDVTGGTVKATGSTKSFGVLVGDSSCVKVSGGEVSAPETGIRVTGSNGLGASAEKGSVVVSGEGTVSGRFGISVHANGVITVEGGEVTGTAAGVGTYGADTMNPTINVTGGEISSKEGVGAYLPAGKMNVSGGTVKGKAGIVVRGGDLDVQGGTIEATGTDNVTIGDAKNSVPAAGITVDNAGYTNQKEGQKHVTIGDGATVKATAEGGKTLAACENGTPVNAPEGKVAAEDNPFSVSGGTFTTGTDTADTSSVNQFLAEGYTYNGDTGITYEDKDNAQATLNGVYYETFAKALEAAGNGDEIKLLKDVDVAGSYITINKTGTLTIDLNGNDISGTGAWVVYVTGKSDLTITGEGTISSNSESSTPLMAGGKDAKLTIAGGTIESKNTNRVAAIAATEGATVAMTGGKVTGTGLLLQAYNGSLVRISGGEIKQTGEADNMCAIYAQDGTTDSPSKVIIEGDAKINAISGVMVSNLGVNELTVTGGTITAKDHAISTNGSSNSESEYAGKQTITISGGTITSEDVALYLPGKGGNVTISGEAEIKGANTGIEVRSGALTVEGGTITGGTDKAATGTTPDVGGSVTSNAGIGVAPYGNQKITLNVTGGTISGGTALYQSTPEDGEGAELTFSLEGGTFEGVNKAVSVDNAKLQADQFVKGGTFTKGEGDAKAPDVSVYQYVGSEHAVDPATGVVNTTAEVPLAIIDFGYIDKMADAELTEDGKFVSDKGFEYNCGDWTDATFYWCFNRALKVGETVEITLTGPNDKTYTDTCEGEGTSPRYATSFLNDTQLGDDVEENGVVTGKYTISGTVGKTAVEAAKGAETATVNVLPLTPEEMAAYEVTVETAKNGTVAVAENSAPFLQDGDSVYFLEGDTVTLTVKANEGYEVEKVVYTVGEDTTALEVTKNAEGQYTFKMPAAKVTVSATFKAVEYAVTVKTAQNGKVEADKTYHVEGDTVTLTVTPDKGYEVEKVEYTYKVGEDTKTITVTETDGKYTFTMPGANVEVSATFKEKPVTPVEKTYKITVDTEIVGGTVTASAKEAKAGETVTLTVKANEGYEVEKVEYTYKVGEDTKTITVTETDGKYTFTMPAADVKVSATFKEKPVTPTTPDTKDLEDAIKAAKAIYDVLDDTDIVADDTKPSSVTKGKTVYPQSAVDALKAAIADAEDALKNATTQDEVDAAVAKLNQAVADFQAAAIVGTKTTYTGNGGGGGSSTGSSTTTKTNPFGGKVTIVTSRDGDKTITVTDKNGQVIAKVEIPAKTPELGYRFEDVPAGHWAEAAIQNMAALKVFQGVSSTRHIFDMNSAVTRGAMAQVLFNLSQGKTGINNPFDDAKDNWYSDAVAWAASVGVVTGMSDTNFAPNDSVTREQLVTMLYRYAQLLALDTNVTADMGKFVDTDEISSWASEAMTWAVGKGLIIGKGAGTLDPTAAASRAEAAVIIDRFLQMV